jgi:CheY-like chemotaxis protein
VPSASSSPRSKLVLIVDDDADAREVLGELIGALGHQAMQAASAQEAVLCAERAQVDVALIDLGLPGTDGYELARRIRSTVTGAGIRLVALTGYSDDESRRSATEAGFDEFLVKPAPSNAIAAVVNGAPER